MRTVVTALLVLLSTIFANAEVVEASAPVVTYKAIAYTPDGAFYMSAHMDNPIDAVREAVAGCTDEYDSLCIAGVSATQESHILLLSCPGVVGQLIVSGSLSPDNSKSVLDPRAKRMRQALREGRCEELWRL